MPKRTAVRCPTRSAIGVLLACAIAAPALADVAPFDLAGPTLSVTVTHRGVTLPIARVPQLATGDVVKVRADLPRDQSAHYLLVAAFLRGSTNPPPDKWFFVSETWKKKGRKGLTLTIPENAEQVMLFLAPETGGDFSTLRNAVQGKPGAFVRSAQDLAQASLDRGRLQTYLAAVRGAPQNDLDRITPLLARSLQIKVNSDCLTKLPDLQAACLLQNQESLVLNDGHSNAITDAVQGPGSDLALQLAATPQGGLGFYSPYIGAIRDIIGIFSSIHTAKYQYIPALATLNGDSMALVLNAPPSFHNPKSVLVTALPIVAPVHIPPLQVPAPAALCRSADDPLLEVTGAPLIFSTDYAHDLSLRVDMPDGRQIDLPATPDAQSGGLRIAIGNRIPAGVKVPLPAHIHGQWGFRPFDGPAVTLQAAGDGAWTLASGANPAPGDTATLAGGASACVRGVSVRYGDAPPIAAKFKRTDAGQLAVTLPASGEHAKTVGLTIDGPPGTKPAQLTIATAPPPAPLPVVLAARNVQRPASAGGKAIIPGDDGEIPDDATLTFSLKATGAARFTAQDRIELRSDATGQTARLTPANGVTLVDPHTLVTTAQPAKLLGPSAYGALKVRVIRDGAASDWLPIGTLVRLPAISAVQCPSDANAACTLTGSSLYLLSAVATTPDFRQPLTVPDGYPATNLPVPRPVDGHLYLRLHDAPGVTNRIDTNA